MMSEFFHFQQFFLKYEGGGVQLTSPPEKTTLKNPVVLGLKRATFLSRPVQSHPMYPLSYATDISQNYILPSHILTTSIIENIYKR